MEMDSGKLFVGGISWDTNEDRLRQYFQNFGDVVEAMIMKDRTTGRARGFGFIVFADPSVAEKVVLEKHVIDGRTVEAKKAIPRDDQSILNRTNNSSHGSPGPTPSPTRSKKIFVGGLASTITESDFKKYFDQFGTITDVVVMYDHSTQRPRGFGFITFSSEDGVEKVLQKTFHELHGKMVEVKRAVPKEFSPSPNRAQLGGYNYGLSRVSSFANGLVQGYNSSLVGGNGLRIDDRLSPGTVGRSGYPFMSPSYGSELSFEPSLSQNENFASTLLLGRALNPSFSGSPIRYSNSMGYAGTSACNNSTISSTMQNFWGNGNLNYATNPRNSDSYVGYGSDNSNMGSFGRIGQLWSSSIGTDQAGTTGSGYDKSSPSYSSGDVILGSKAVGYEKSQEKFAAPASSYGLSNGKYDETYNYKDTYEAGSFYGVHTWRFSPSEQEDAGSLGFGLGNVVSDLMSQRSGAHIEAHAVANRQPNRGIAA
ncbi:putative RNA recognition motif domain-containing protein [Lupinus albus]|uniref:Putative RNA recognition motif domain-containing protein n=1 Tax=Lupinus albus TaxID=3870 RepID=A0A6A4PA94_LUPAL|nr:putative RNA recognition motif domain-containing protein [Lupinus albus]